MPSWRNSPDLDGNYWPRWNEEECLVDAHRLDMIAIFNKLVAVAGNPIFPDRGWPCLPLPDDTPYFLIHNEVVHLDFTDKVLARSQPHTCHLCAVVLARIQVSGYPTIVGDGSDRVVVAVNPHHREPDRLAMYRLDVPAALTNEINKFDETGRITKFTRLWDPNKDFLRSPVPSRGPAWRAQTKGSGSPRFGSDGGSGSSRSPTNNRPSLKKLASTIRKEG